MLITDFGNRADDYKYWGANVLSGNWPMPIHLQPEANRTFDEKYNGWPVWYTIAAF